MPVLCQRCWAVFPGTDTHGPCSNCGWSGIRLIVDTSTLSLTDLAGASKDTIQSTIQASGSYGRYYQHYVEATNIVEKAAAAGSMNPEEISALKKTLEKWRILSKEYSGKITELTKKNEPEKLIGIAKEIDGKVSNQQQTLQAIYEKISADKILSQIVGFFDVKASDEEETKNLKDMAHSTLLGQLLKWIGTRNGEIKLFGDIIHGPKESGIDLLGRLLSDASEKVGLQLKNDNDVKAKDFTTKLKAQILDSKKHALRCLVILLAADVTDPPAKMKIRGIISDLSQMRDEFILVVSPEKTVTIIREVS